MSLSHPATQGAQRTVDRSARSLAPGVAWCAIAALVSIAISRMLPGVSPLIAAIVLGVVAANTAELPTTAAPGVDFSAKRLLRVGIVLLGLQLVLSDIVSLGAPMLFVVVCIVAGGLLGTLALGRLLRVRSRLSLLIACGFSICGAAAVAGAAGVIDPDAEDEENTVTAVALVVIFGTLVIPLLPIAAGTLGLDSHTAGLWAGGSIHEIAQVVATGGIIGDGALTVAVIVKLARVLLLAPVAAILSVRERRQHNAQNIPAALLRKTKAPPLIPLFIIGFLMMVMVRSFLPLPEIALSVGGTLQTFLLACAMFGLGCAVKVRTLLNVGPRPFALAALSTLLVATIAYVGIMLVS